MFESRYSDYGKPKNVGWPLPVKSGIYSTATDTVSMAAVNAMVCKKVHGIGGEVMHPYRVRGGKARHVVTRQQRMVRKDASTVIGNRCGRYGLKLGAIAQSISRRCCLRSTRRTSLKNTQVTGKSTARELSMLDDVELATGPVPL